MYCCCSATPASRTAVDTAVLLLDFIAVAAVSCTATTVTVFVSTVVTTSSLLLPPAAVLASSKTNFACSCSPAASGVGYDGCVSEGRARESQDQMMDTRTLSVVCFVKMPFQVCSANVVL